MFDLYLIQKGSGYCAPNALLPKEMQDPADLPLEELVEWLGMGLGGLGEVCVCVGGGGGGGGGGG